MNRRQLSIPASSARASGVRLLTIFLIFLLIPLIIGCYQPVSPSVPQLTPSQTNATTTPTSASETNKQPVLIPPSPSPTVPSYRLWLPPYLPEQLRSGIILSGGVSLADTPDGADMNLEVSNQPKNASSIWIYALVAPFPTITDGISSDELRTAWTGGSIPPFNDTPLLMDESTYRMLSVYWSTPASQAVLVLPDDQLLDQAWSNQPSWAIVPFEALDPQWKVLTVDGQSPIRQDFDAASYALSIPISLNSSVNLIADQIRIPATNRDATKLTTVAMTGVTAMVRATAYTMEMKGIQYPAQDIGSILASADITHISNEIPFSPDCPYPSQTSENLVFCSNPDYIKLLKAVGTDIIELTGDHFMDYGAGATLYTLQMYKDLGWPHYGGGADAQEARQPVKMESNGNRIAFMGCNVGCTVKPSIPCDAIATDEHPGAAQCDYDWIASEIPALRDEGYQVIFTFQHNEYYTYTTEPDLSMDFGRVAMDGATIISGSQAHQPHGFSFQEGAFIHYGLGNLFFDQYHYCAYYACDDAFIDQHVFYDNKYISTELITIRFADYARPRLMTPEERQRFLEIIFNASDWQGK